MIYVSVPDWLFALLFCWVVADIAKIIVRKSTTKYNQVNITQDKLADAYARCIAASGVKDVNMAEFYLMLSKELGL